MSKELDDLLRFVSLTHQIREVKRAILVKTEDQFENDSEHGYQLAMTARYIIETRQLDLDVDKCTALALVHDIVEVYSGDTPVFGPQELLDTKAERERAARITLQEEWPEFASLHALVDEYEARETKEAKFVYAFDKVLPILNNYLDGGRSWRLSNITLADHVILKEGKASLDPTAKAYYEQIIAVLGEHPEMFPTKD